MLNNNATLVFLEANSLCWTRYQQNIRKGTHTPWCMPDGSFSPLQIQGSRFFCVNAKGAEVAGTSVDVSQGKPDCHAASKFYQKKFFHKEKKLIKSKLCKFLMSSHTSCRLSGIYCDPLSARTGTSLVSTTCSWQTCPKLQGRRHI